MKFKWGFAFYLIHCSLCWAQVEKPQMETDPPSTATIDWLEISFSHKNDLDIIGGNDVGETFSNELKIRRFKEWDEHPIELYGEFRNRLITERQVIAETALFPTETKNLNYLEEFRLRLGGKYDFKPAKDTDGLFQFRPFAELELDFDYVTSKGTAVGTGLQENVHRSAAGVQWVYDDNQLDMSEFNVDLNCRIGTEIRFTEFITCDAYLGGRLRTTDIDGSVVETGGSVRIHTRAPDWFSRRRPTFALVSEIDCETIPTEEESDVLLRFGAETNINLDGRSRIRCQILWQEALDVNENSYSGMLDDDDQLQILMGVIF